jgi:hypothetical protein
MTEPIEVEVAKRKDRCGNCGMSREDHPVAICTHFVSAYRLPARVEPVSICDIRREFPASCVPPVILDEHLRRVEEPSTSIINKAHAIYDEFVLGTTPIPSATGDEIAATGLLDGKYPVEIRKDMDAKLIRVGVEAGSYLMLKHGSNATPERGEDVKLLVPLSKERITPEIRLMASRAILSHKEDGAFSLTAHLYAAYTIIREQELLAALKENALIASHSLYARRSFHNLQRCNQFFERCENPVCQPFAPLACIDSSEQPLEVPGDRAKIERILELEAVLALRDEEIARLECQLAEMKAEFIDQLHRDEQTQQDIKEVLGEK